MRQYVFKLQRELLKDGEPERLTKPEDAYRYLMENCFRSESMYREYAYLVFLNSFNEAMGTAVLSVGGLSSTTFDEKLAAKLSLFSMARQVILAHNHPASSPLPSNSDLRNTAKIRDALALFDIKLADHIVVADGSYYSFAEEKEYKVA